MNTPKANEKVNDKTTTPEIYETLKWNGWGEEGVQMTLDYPNKMARHVDGKPIRNILKFLNSEIRNESQSETIPEESPSITFDEAVKKLNPQTLNELFINEAKNLFDTRQIRTDPLSRITHLAGKNYRDLWRVRKGLVERAPDCIFLPNSHDDCVRLVNLAQKHNVALIPFGGGTTVTGGVEANPLETRMVVSVDMRRMNRLIHIDKESMLATVEAGIAGPWLDKLLGKHGFTCGHDPDSFVYSTLGGWICARGSGAMSNQYGDIEDMVIAMKVATPTGVIETPITSRTCGVDLNGIFIGSEGAFGIVTEATIKLEPLPECTYYGGYLFPNFESAFSAFRECIKSNAKPCVMRLYDEDDFRLSMAMSTSEHSTFSSLITTAVKTYLSKYKGWDMRNVSLVIVGYEGTKSQVAFQKNEVHSVFKRFGGFNAGKGPGASWQEKKYDLPHVRDFALSVSHWADVFETSVLYSEAIECWRAVKKAVRDVWKENGKTGWIACHTAHQYRYGCCLYFTFASSQGDENDMKIFLQIKKRAMEAMLKHTGNLTHHHGIGYEHVPWMTRYMGEGCMNILYSLKAKIDPKNICNPDKLLPVLRAPNESDEQWKMRQERELMFDKIGVPGAYTTSHLEETSKLISEFEKEYDVNDLAEEQKS